MTTVAAALDEYEHTRLVRDQLPLSPHVDEGWAVVARAVADARAESAGSESTEPGGTDGTRSAPRVPSSSPNERISTDEAAILLNCTTRNVRKTAAAGGYATAQLHGRRWTVERAEIEAIARRGTAS